MQSSSVFFNSSEQLFLTNCDKNYKYLFLITVDKYDTKNIIPLGSEFFK